MTKKFHCKLLKWVQTQRKFYWCYFEKKELEMEWSGKVMDNNAEDKWNLLNKEARGMNEERFQLLKEQGFVWRDRKGRRGRKGRMIEGK